MSQLPDPIHRLPFQPFALAATHWFLESQREMFDLNPPYQRASVWQHSQRVALILSLLRGIPIGSIVYNERSITKGNFIAIIDGKQRIETIRAFVDSEFAVPAWWFDEHEVKSRDGEATFRDLTVVGQRRIQMLPMPGLQAHVDSIAEEAAIYDLINTGGTAQTDADIANARAIAEGAR